MSQDTSGMAFPGYEYTPGRGCSRKNDDGEWESHSPGMTLRDYFAAKAMGAMLFDHTIEQHNATLARKAYQVADAMLNERAQR